MTSEVPSAETSHPPLAHLPLAQLVEDQVIEVQAAMLELRRDLEGALHEARVGLRKLRSTLAIYRTLLETEPAKSLRRELTWLAGELGPARDGQVLLERMRQSLLEEGRDDLDEGEVAAHFEAFAERGFTRGRAAVESDRFSRLLTRLDVVRLRSPALTGDLTGDLAGDLTGDLTGDLAGQDLGRLVRDLDTSAGASDTHLHDLRKAVKRARYVRGANDEVDAALKRVQAVLGEHQDSVVAREQLSQLASSELVACLVEREEQVAEQSERRLRKAVRALHVALHG